MRAPNKPSGELFIKNLAGLLQSTRRTGASLARYLEVDRSLITAWTKGRSDPGIRRLSQLAAFFEVPISRFFIDR